jgi:hypothetical protein
MQKKCAVCDIRDARALVEVALASGTRVTLCGSHELMHRRSKTKAKTAADLRAAFGERRDRERRGKGEVDELAARLSAAFGRERRGAERRAG